ncbi:hypothetical protein A7A08_01146 [Methyloligella halotolerans]|uniref:Peptidase M15C domain-containing protein n=1 Tax=Methyloligella halotolerans TaxID=1177755 RepID=A0A1E2S0G7_9HYPH|nr:M15 family metallopeptidase [Methyloligella halotolerans]ODA67977.1 hypothetical protein A7A08_01146 [Methyloligella halotolerans]
MASTSELRNWWRRYECKRDDMTRIDFCEDSILVAPESVDAFHALATVLKRHRYSLRPGDTDSYNCRTITGGNGRSLHSYGIALDINWNTNPYRDHPGRRDVRYSDKPTQAERAAEVRAGTADTDMTPAMIADILSIKTVGGRRVFQWGGDWSTLKDSMHFQIDLPPGQLAEGIDPESVGPEIADEVAEVFAEAVTNGAGRYRVISRSGLRLRSGPGTEFDIIKLLPLDTLVYEMGRDGLWSQISLEDDGIADGHVHGSYLERPGAIRATLSSTWPIWPISLRMKETGAPESSPGTSTPPFIRARAAISTGIGPMCAMD